MDNKSKYEFPIPDGFSVPEGHEGGDKPFDVVCSFRAKPDGKTVCMLKMGETDTGYEKDGEKPEYKKDYSDMAQGMMSAIPEDTGSGGGGAGGSAY